MRPARREWLVTLAAALWVAAVMVTWFGWSYARANPRFEALPPGETLRLAELEMRVVSVRQTDAYQKDRAVLQAPPGARFVQVVVDLRASEGTTRCGLWLIGSQGRRWTPKERSCYVVSAGQTEQVSLIFLVSESDVATVVGVAPEPGRRLARMPVARPAVT